MSTIDNYGTIESLGLTQSSEQNGKGNSELGQDAFFKLMTTQLQNQDPTKPLESNEFLGQIAQFSQVSGIQEMNASLAGLADSLISSQTLQAASLVGRSVLAPMQEGYLTQGDAIGGVIELPASASGVNVTISGPSGETVRSISLGTQSAGDLAFRWDGLDEAGNPMASGSYTIKAEAIVDGEPLALNTLIEADVESVSLNGSNGMSLNLRGLGSMSLNEIREIR